MKMIELDERLFAEAEEVAAEKGRNVTAIIEDALREAFSRRKSEHGSLEGRERVKLPTHGVGGLQPGIDLDNTAALWDLMDGSNAAS